MIKISEHHPRSLESATHQSYSECNKDSNEQQVEPRSSMLPGLNHTDLRI